MMLLEFLKLAGLVTLPFTVYFAWMKIGNRVAASYSWQFGSLTAPGIGTVTLINLKDRPLPIFEVHAVMDSLSFKLKTFDPPFILKALEAVNIEAEIVSKRYLGPEAYDWTPPAGKSANVDIYLSTASRTIKCRRQGPSSRLGFVTERKLHLISDETSRFNGVIYNDNARFAITYTEDNQEKTALIDIGGMIHWNRTPNGLHPQDIQNVETVKAAIAACGLAPWISPFAVDDLRERRQPRTPRASKASQD